MNNTNKRTLDHFKAKAIYFISVVYEKIGQLTKIRPELFSSYKNSCLVHDTIG